MNVQRSVPIKWNLLALKCINSTDFIFACFQLILWLVLFIFEWIKKKNTKICLNLITVITITKQLKKNIITIEKKMNVYF